MAQLAYDQEMPVAFEGMKADSTDDQVESFHNQEATLGIPLGKVVGQAADQYGCKRLAAVTDKMVGLSIHSHFLDRVSDTDNSVPPKSMVNVMSRGRCWTKVEDAVTPSSVVYARAVATGAEVPGALRGTADGTDTIRIFGARFITAASAGGLAMVEIDMNAHLAGAA